MQPAALPRGQFPVSCEVQFLLCGSKGKHQCTHGSLPVPWLPAGARGLPSAAATAFSKVVVIGQVAVQGWSFSAGNGERGGDRGGRRQGRLGQLPPWGTRLVPGGCPGAQAPLCQLPGLRKQSPGGRGPGGGRAGGCGLSAGLGAAVDAVADDDAVAEAAHGGHGGALLALHHGRHAPFRHQPLDPAEGVFPARTRLGAFAWKVGSTAQREFAAGQDHTGKEASVRSSWGILRQKQKGESNSFGESVRDLKARQDSPNDPNSHFCSTGRKTEVEDGVRWPMPLSLSRGRAGPENGHLASALPAQVAG